MAIARWKDLCLDASDAHRLARFWGSILGLEIELHDDGDAALRGARPEETIWVNAVPEPKTAKHRVHLDVEVAAVEPLLAAGATVVLPAEESGFHWSVLADPDGGELCAFVRADQSVEPPARLYEVVVDTADVASAHAQAEWWASVWGGRVVDDPRGYSWLEEVPGAPLAAVAFVPVPEPKTVKNRIHWDLTCDDVPALVARGATVLAQPTERTPWHVLADPEGNEVCAFPSSAGS
ncbi:MAG: VOC family protein [Acidimicrobiia bacterium]|jgi:catechol 2,3-dioxygenase-like lactoylglutathione lyase family enzyme